MERIKANPMEQTSLFEEFETSTLQEWKDTIVKDLKGKNYEDTLLWEDDNNIRHQPVYSAESIADNELIKAIQAAQKKSTHWGNVQLFDALEENAVELVTESLKNGLDFAFIENATEYKAFINSKPVGKKIYFFLDKIDITHLPKCFLVDPIKETQAKPCACPRHCPRTCGTVSTPWARHIARYHSGLWSWGSKRQARLI